MIIHIPLNDLKPPYNEVGRIEHPWQVGIDYATNTIDACDRYEVNEFGDQKCVSIFHFNDWDMRLNNRWNTYEISCGAGGIIIDIQKTRNELTNI